MGVVATDAATIRAGTLSAARPGLGCGEESGLCGWEEAEMQYGT
jgi:hypothetical protein